MLPQKSYDPQNRRNISRKLTSKRGFVVYRMFSPFQYCLVNIEEYNKNKGVIIMLQERINRVINNHQMSCEHRSHYLYILKGFNVVLDRFTVPVENLDINRIEEQKNFYIKYEEAMTLGDGIIKRLKDNNYDIWIVEFNLFEGAYLAKRVLSDYLEATPLDDFYLVQYPDLSWVETHKTIAIFNTDNPLKGISDMPLDSDARIDLFKSMK